MTATIIKLDYPSILKQRVLKGEITWQGAFDWLQAQGMDARYATKALGDPPQKKMSKALKTALDEVGKNS